MKIYNDLTSQKEDFVPLGDTVKMYVCGVTPYDNSHFGHAMSYVFFDVIRRYLKFRGFRLKYVQNVTDIEDKIILRANQRGISTTELAEKFTASYFADMDALITVAEKYKIKLIMVLFDYQLALAILKELKLRGIDLACENEKQLNKCYQQGNKDHIVLISEWDTHYGRLGLPDAMYKALNARKLGDCLKLNKKLQKECLELDQKKWVHTFSYMRGLDGVVPGEGKTDNKSQPNKENDTSKNPKSGLERPEGQSQKDYRVQIQTPETLSSEARASSILYGCQN